MDKPPATDCRHELIADLLVEAAALMEDASAMLVVTLPIDRHSVVQRIALARRTARRVRRLARRAAMINRYD